MGRGGEGSESTPKFGAGPGSCATTSELHTDGCVLQHKPISNPTISYIFRLRFYLPLVYVIDDYRDVFTTPFNFILSQVTLKCAENGPKRSQCLG